MTPGVIDVRIVTRHLAALREALRVLSKHSCTPIEYLMLSKRLSDFETFASHIEAYVQTT